MSDVPQLVVTPSVVGRRLGLSVPTDDQLARITDAILDAQDAVEAELNRPLFAEVVVLAGQRPKYGHVDLAKADAWDTDFDDDVTVESVEPEPGGTYVVTFKVGLDGPNEPAVGRYVRAHAVEDVRLDPASGMGTLAVTSLSAEGQSVSFDSKRSTDGAGALPTLKTLRHLKRYGVRKTNSPVRAPWPMTDIPVGWDPR